MSSVMEVGTTSSKTNIHDVASADDAPTLLCHLGYLCYDASMGTARVPNEEVRAELRQAVAQSRHAEVARIARESGALLEATWDLDEGAVAEAMSRANDDGCVSALLVELRWDRSPEAAIAQARKRDYPAVLRGWGGTILLVGITYERKSKCHTCVIEEA